MGLESPKCPKVLTSQSVQENANPNSEPCKKPEVRFCFKTQKPSKHKPNTLMQKPE